MRGDKIRVLVDVGATEAREFVVEATKAGRTVEVETVRGGMIEVSECKRNGGEPVRTDRFMASRVVALIEEKTEPDEAEAESLPGLEAS